MLTPTRVDSVAAEETAEAAVPVYCPAQVVKPVPYDFLDGLARLDGLPLPRRPGERDGLHGRPVGRGARLPVGRGGGRRLAAADVGCPFAEPGRGRGKTRGLRNADRFRTARP
jgi:hypothetical protein